MANLGIRELPRKAVALATAAVLAASMVPATALAQTVAPATVDMSAVQHQASASTKTVGAGGNNQGNGGKALASTKNDPEGKTPMWADGAWVTDPAKVTNGVYQWRTTVKGDGAHYGHYDALVTFTVRNKVLTSVDLTSEGTTFGGKWGAISPKSGVGITGYLPQGVTLNAVQDASDGAAVQVGLSGTEEYGGFTVSSITLCASTADGSLEMVERQEWDAEDQHYDTIIEPKGYNVADSLTAAAAASEAGASTRAKGDKDKGPSLASTDSQDTSVVNWKSASKSFTLSEQAAKEYNLAKVTYKIGDYFIFDQYIALDGAAGTGAKYKVQPTDLDAEATGIGAKNRDVYTGAAYAVMLQRQLMSWSEAVSGGSLSDLDVVSAATKSSDSLIESLYALDGYTYPSSNHDNPQDLLGAASWGKLFTSVSDQLAVTLDGGKASASNAWDQTSVTTNAAGDYVLSYKLSKDIPLSALAFCKSDQHLSFGQMWRMASSDTGKVSEFVTRNTGAYTVLESLADSEVVSDDVSWNSATNTVTIKKGSGINYVIVGLGVGKLTQDRTTGEVPPLKGQSGIFCLPYSLEDMAAATNVTNQIRAMANPTAATIASVRAAYNALSSDAKTFVGRAEVAKLSAATPAPAATTVAQKLTVSNLAKSYSASYVKSGKLKAAKSFTLKTTGAKGKVTYKVSSIGATAKKYLSVTSAGKVTVKKGAPVGTYTMKVKASAAKAVAGSTTYPASSVTKTVTVTVGSQTVKLAASSKTVSYAKASKKAQTLTVATKTSAGKITSAKNVSTDKTAKKFTVKKSGTKKVTVKVPKGTKKGTYAVKVQLKSPKVAKKYAATTATCTLKVKVR